MRNAKFPSFLRSSEKRFLGGFRISFRRNYGLFRHVAAPFRGPQTSTVFDCPEYVGSGGRSTSKPKHMRPTTAHLIALPLRTNATPRKRLKPSCPDSFGRRHVWIRFVKVSRRFVPISCAPALFLLSLRPDGGGLLGVVQFLRFPIRFASFFSFLPPSLFSPFPSSTLSFEKPSQTGPTNAPYYFASGWALRRSY